MLSPPYLSNMIGLPAFETPYGMIMAGTLLMIVPVIIVFLVGQRFFIEGIKVGAIKG